MATGLCRPARPGAILAAVEAALRECPFTDLANEPNFAPLVVHGLTDAGSWAWLPPPLTENTVAAICRRLVASEH